MKTLENTWALRALCTTSGCSACHLDRIHIGFNFIFIIILCWLHLILQFIKVHWEAGIQELKNIFVPQI